MPQTPAAPGQFQGFKGVAAQKRGKYYSALSGHPMTAEGVPGTKNVGCAPKKLILHGGTRT